MTAPTEQEIRKAIEHGPHGTVDALDEWLYEALSRLYERWPCDSTSCPAQPESDRAREALFEKLSPAVAQEVDRLVTKRFTAALSRFAAKYPDAPRAREKVPA